MPFLPNPAANWQTNQLIHTHHDPWPVAYLEWEFFSKNFSSDKNWFSGMSVGSMLTFWNRKVNWLYSWFKMLETLIWSLLSPILSATLRLQDSEHSYQDWCKWRRELEGCTFSYVASPCPALCGSNRHVSKSNFLFQNLKCKLKPLVSHKQLYLNFFLFFTQLPDCTQEC